MTKENPALTANDILFCAYIKLNFSNKEIAEYAHLSIRTVESKKVPFKEKNLVYLQNLILINGSQNIDIPFMKFYNILLLSMVYLKGANAI
ncbi:hypothetical protein HX13_06345 [Chryseobacterium sp. P1-3]|nr:hypothetical protein HX13_06345 [Chryseobacterium sp. P1-3]